MLPIRPSWRIERRFRLTSPNANIPQDHCKKCYAEQCLKFSSRNLAAAPAANWLVIFIAPYTAKKAAHSVTSKWSLNAYHCRSTQLLGEKMVKTIDNATALQHLPAISFKRFWNVKFPSCYFRSMSLLIFKSETARTEDQCILSGW